MLWEVGEKCFHQCLFRLNIWVSLWFHNTNVKVILQSFPVTRNIFKVYRIIHTPGSDGETTLANRGPVFTNSFYFLQWQMSQYSLASFPSRQYSYFEQVIYTLYFTSDMQVLYSQRVLILTRIVHFTQEFIYLV